MVQTHPFALSFVMQGWDSANSISSLPGAYWLFRLGAVGEVIESDERLEEEKWTCSFLLASCGLPILVTLTLAVLLHPGTSVFVVGVFQHL